MRSRLIWPGFFDDHAVASLPFGARLLFAGLWCLADREGRLLDLPRRIVAQIFPHDVERYAAFADEAQGWLALLCDAGLILRYGSDGQRYIAIKSFAKYQRPHPREQKSLIPSPHVKSETAPRQTLGLPKANLRQALGNPQENLGNALGNPQENLGNALGIPYSISNSISDSEPPPPTPPSVDTQSPPVDESGRDAGDLIEEVVRSYPNRTSIALGKRLLAERAASSPDPIAFLLRVQKWLELMVQSPQWHRERGRYIPTLATVCRDERYLDFEVDEPPGEQSSATAGAMEAPSPEELDSYRRMANDASLPEAIREMASEALARWG